MLFKKMNKHQVSLVLVAYQKKHERNFTTLSCLLIFSLKIKQTIRFLSG